MEIFTVVPGRFDVVITDQSMPHLTGIELAERMLTIRPDIPIILITGLGKQLSDREKSDIGIRECTGKPADIHGLVKLIEQVIEQVV
ncbi:MAG: response regulator [Proteobacteria bacterium]|nr:response regulator [Pseudomonadota bacterium]